MKDNIYLHSCREAGLLYCDSSSILENCTVSTASGEIIPLQLLRKETLAEAFEDPIFRMLRIGKECGCKFTVGSDAHSEADYDNFDKIYVISEILELKEDDFHPLTR